MKYLPLVLLLSSCVLPETPAPESPVPVEVKPPPVDPCEMAPEKIGLQFYDKATKTKGTYLQDMPVTKSMAHESHYLIAGLDPKSVSTGEEKTKEHFARTCTKLLRGTWAKFYPGMDDECKKVYTRSGATQWSPAEPKIGRGVADYYPSVECEAATANMYWDRGQRPAYGTRFLVTNPKNKKSFVLCMGYEAGPGSKERSGGLSTEALYYLGASHGSVLTLGRLKNQGAAFGPIECK